MVASKWANGSPWPNSSASSLSPSVEVYSDSCRKAAKIGSGPTDGGGEGVYTAASEPEPEGGVISKILQLPVLC